MNRADRALVRNHSSPAGELVDVGRQSRRRQATKNARQQCQFWWGEGASGGRGLTG